DGLEVGALVAAQILADAVEDHDRVVDRIAGEREQTGDRRQVEVELEDRKQAHRHEHVMKGRDQRGDAELPFEAERDIEGDHQDRKARGDQAVPIELLADTRSYELDPAVLYSGPERALDRLDDDLLVDRLLGRLDADQERVAGAELLDFDLAEAEGVHLGPHVGHVKGLRADDVDQIAAGEIDAEIEAAH